MKERTKQRWNKMFEIIGKELTILIGLVFSVGIITGVARLSYGSVIGYSLGIVFMLTLILTYVVSIIHILSKGGR